MEKLRHWIFRNTVLILGRAPIGWVLILILVTYGLLTIGLRLVRRDAIFCRNDDRNDAMWAWIEHMLPGKATAPGTTPADNRRFLESVLWWTRTGSPWHDPPERFNNWNGLFERFRRWLLSGICGRVFNNLSDEFDLE